MSAAMAVLKRSALLIVALLPISEVVAQPDTLAVQPADTIVVQTDRAAYGPLEVVTVTFVNRRDSTVYLVSDGCRTLGGEPFPRVRLERQEANAWVRYAPGFACGGTALAPVPLRPGEPYRVRFQVGLFGPLPLGTYRYVFSVLEDGLRPETRLPDDVATSNTFEVGV